MLLLFFQNFPKTANNNLVGTILSELALLSAIQEINFNHNDFSKSTIPTEMFTLSKLKTLSMKNCSLSGTISSIGMSQMTSIISIDIGTNHLAGSLPTELGSLTS